MTAVSCHSLTLCLTPDVHILTHLPLCLIDLIVETYLWLRCPNDGRLMPLIDIVPHPRCPHIDTSPSLSDGSHIVETYLGLRCPNDGRLMPLIDILPHPRFPHIGTSHSPFD